MVIIAAAKKIAPALLPAIGRAHSSNEKKSTATSPSTSRMASSAYIKSQHQAQKMRKEEQRAKMFIKTDRSQLFKPGVAVVRRKTIATIMRNKKNQALVNFLSLRKRRSSFHRRLVDLHQRKSWVLPLISHGSEKAMQTQYYRRTPCDCARYQWDSLGDLSADDDSDDKEGRWDSWKAYYCNRPEIAAAAPINPFYLAWTILYTIGQNTHMTLIQLTFQNGGVAFLLVCLIVYIGVGYPMYIMETMIGQYSGRKTLTMFRFMAPYLQGVGPALWLRTFFIGLECFVSAIFSLHLCVDLYVCELNHNSLLRGFWYNMNPGKVNLGAGPPPDIKNDPGFFLNNYLIEWVILSVAVTTVLALMKLRIFGHLYVLVWKGAFLVWTGYLIIAILRTFTSKGTNSIMFFPLFRVLRTDWWKMLSPKVWMDAVLYVIRSLGLVTIVHPYFGSRSFFHYRAARDGVIIIALTILWNLLGATSTLLFLGYVTPNSKEMCNSLEQFAGYFGLFVTYPMKHVQAYVMQDLEFDLIRSPNSPAVCSQTIASNNSSALFNVVEYDIEFFCSIFYAMVALVGVCAYHSCLGALIACSFHEYTSTAMAITIGFVILILYALLTPLLFVSPGGLSLLLTIEFYIHHTFTVIFIALCFFWGLAYSHKFAKLVYDIRNMLHFPVFEPKDENDLLNSHFPALFRNVIFIGLLAIFVYMVFRYPFPSKPGVQFSLANTIIGFLITGLPIVYTFFMYFLVCFQRAYGSKFQEKHFKPHRDWYKNWFHIVVCFAAAPFRRQSMAARSQMMEETA